MRKRRIVRLLAWTGLYLLLTLAPLFALLIDPQPVRREFWREFSVALGFSGLAMMGLQFALTARFQRFKPPYGIDLVYHFHRQISVVAFAFILAHPIILIIIQPRTLNLLNIFQAPWQSRFGVLGVIGFLIIIATSLWREPLKLPYTPWRILHGLLATGAIALALAHAVMVGFHINTPLKQALWSLYGVFWISMLLYVRVFKPFMMLRRPWEVVEVVPERGDAYTLALQPVGHDGMRFMPGQFAWLTAWQSPFADREHPFSFVSSAECQDRVEFGIKELGDFTSTIQKMVPGQTVYLDGPFGIFSVDRYPNAGQFAFIAGGIGITPILSMLRTLADRGDQRPLLLIYANQDLDGMSYRMELDQLKERLNLRVVYVLENPPEGWEGYSGFLTREILEEELPKDRETNPLEIFICGPPPMMDIAEQSLAEMGVPLGDFHSERFNLV